MKNRTWLVALCATLSVGAITACGTSGTKTGNGSANSTNSSSTTTTTSSSSSSDKLMVGLSADVSTLDPAKSSSMYDRQVMFNIYDTLFQITPSGKITTDLVKSYTISKDGKTYTLQLQQGVKFQDGTTFDAAAVKFNFDRDMQKGSPRRSDLSEVQSVDTPSKYTVVIHLKAPFSPLLGILADRAGMMVSPAAVKKEGSNFANDPVGTGPFEFKNEVKGDHITLVKNPTYWGTPAKLNTVEFKVFTDTNVEAENLLSGAVDLTDTLPAQQISSVQNNANLSVINKPGLGYGGIYLNVQKAPLNNKYLREAVDQAIDRNAIVNVALKGTATPGQTPFSQAFAVYNKQEDTVSTPNSANIKKLLTEGGQPNGFSFTLQTSSDSVSVQIAQMIQSMLSQYGIKMDIQQLDFTTLLNNANNHAFEASALSWSGRIDPDQNLYQFVHTNGSENDSGYSNQQVDSLLEQARSESSMSARAKTYAQVMSILHQDVPYIYLYHRNNVEGINKKVQGFQAYPDGMLRLDSVSIS